MQTASTHAQRRTWLKWGSILFFGGILAGLEMLLPAEVREANGIDIPWYIIVILVLLYLLIPAVAEFLAARRQETGYGSFSVGCLVGVVSLLVIAVALTVYIVIFLNTPQPPSNGRLMLPPDFAIWVGIGLFLNESVGAVFGGLIGGWIGRKLGRRRQA